MFWCFSQGHRMCLSLEAAITVEEQRSAKNTPFFPITIGRWGLKSVSSLLRLKVMQFVSHSPSYSSPGDPPIQPFQLLSLSVLLSLAQQHQQRWLRCVSVRPSHPTLRHQYVMQSHYPKAHQFWYFKVRPTLKWNVSFRILCLSL